MILQSQGKSIRLLVLISLASIHCFLSFSVLADSESLAPPKDPSPFANFNEGTRLLTEKKYALSYVYLQKAYLKSPLDPNILYNLKQAELNIPNIARLNEVESIFERIIFHSYFNFVIIGLAMLSFVYSIYWLYLLFTKSHLVFHSIFFLLTSVAFLFSWISFDLYSMRSFALIIHNTNGYSEPNADASVVSNFEIAKKVRVLDAQQEWSQVIYSGNGHRAWVLTSHLLPLTSK